MVRSGRTLIYWLFCGKLRILVLGGDVHNSKHVVMFVSFILQFGTHCVNIGVFNKVQLAYDKKIQLNK